AFGETALLVEPHPQLAPRELEAVAGPRAVDPDLGAPRAFMHGARRLEPLADLASFDLGRLAEQGEELAAAGLRALVPGDGEELVGAGVGFRYGLLQLVDGRRGIGIPTGPEDRLERRAVGAVLERAV